MEQEHRIRSIATTDSMTRHNLMYEIAEVNVDKGRPGGDCNITQCQKPGASSYNAAMKAFYCFDCAYDIKRSSNGMFEVDVVPDYALSLGNNPDERELCSRVYKNNEAQKPQFFKQVQHSTKKLGRNSLCPCGSGLKYKKCCI